VIALVVGAWALECHEVENMALAGVPHAQIAAEISGAGTPVGMDFLGCLFAREVDHGLVEAASRVHAVRQGRSTPLEQAVAVGRTRRVQLAVECGSVDWRAASDGRITVSGRGSDGSELVFDPVGNTLAVAVTERDAAPLRGPEVALPQFGGSRRPPDTERAGRPREACADLVVTSPPELAVAVRTTRADVRLHGLAGALEVIDDFGRVEVVGRNADVRVRTTGGDVYVDTGAVDLEIETVSGQVVAGLGTGARATITSVSGDIWTYGGPIQRLSANAVSADVHLFGTFADGGRGELVSHNGQVMARVPDGRLQLASHSGEVLAPDRSQPAAPFDPAGQGPAWAGLWNDTPTRWWFGAGAVLSSRQQASSSEFELAARSFSGDVDVAVASGFPAPTGPIITTIEGVSDRLDRCAAEQFARSGGEGHAVASFTIRTDGALNRLTAPATAEDPAHVSDGVFSACVVTALERLAFEPGARVKVRWPVRFGPPTEPWSTDLVRSQLRAMRAARRGEPGRPPVDAGP
jgi:hypothetical protein